MPRCGCSSSARPTGPAPRWRAPLLRRELAGRNGAEMWSAGFASEDQQALPEAVAAMAEVGIALRPHRTRLLDTGQCRRADLVAAMTRRHVIGVALVSPETWPRTVPLGDLLAQARRVGPRAGAEPARDWVRRLHGERQRAELFALPRGRRPRSRGRAAPGVRRASRPAPGRGERAGGAPRGRTRTVTTRPDAPRRSWIELRPGATPAATGAPVGTVSLVHEYLTRRGGAERRALAMAEALPGAPLHTSLYQPESTSPGFAHVEVRPLGLNRLGVLRKHHRLALSVLAPAFSLLRVDADVVVVVCSSSGWAHGVVASGRKVVYCHTPTRWLYQAGRYLGGGDRAEAARAARLLRGRQPGARRSRPATAALGSRGCRLGLPAPRQLDRHRGAGPPAPRPRCRDAPPWSRPRSQRAERRSRWRGWCRATGSAWHACCPTRTRTWRSRRSGGVAAASWSSSGRGRAGRACVRRARRRAERRPLGPGGAAPPASLHAAAAVAAIGGEADQPCTANPSQPRCAQLATRPACPLTVRGTPRGQIGGPAARSEAALGHAPDGASGEASVDERPIPGVSSPCTRTWSSS